MSLHYLLDGYNITHQVAALAKGELQEQRSLLVRFLDVHRPQGSIKNQVTIFFDGKKGVTSPSHSSCVNIIFSQGETADQAIKKFVAQSNQKKNIVVITNDRDIQFAARAQGAQVKSVREFFKEGDFPSVKIRRDKGRPREAELTKTISKSLEFKINTEFKRIWLERKENENS